MASFEGSHLNLLQGVSQQVPRSRLPGQLTSQNNMLSDPVTGLRRRPGAEFKYQQEAPTATKDTVIAWRTDISGRNCEVVLDCSSGVVTLRNADGSIIHTFAANDYLKSADSRTIRYAAVGESLFVANVAQIPVGVRTPKGKDPNKYGYFYIRNGAISKTYSVTITHSAGSSTYSYTTPDGTTVGDAAKSTVDYIAEQLYDQMQSNTTITATRTGAYVTVAPAGSQTDLSVTTGSGTNFVGTSGRSHVRTEAELPAILPAGADGYTIATGLDRSYVYYSYSHEQKAWLEVGAYGGVSSITNMPVEIYWDGTWTLENPEFEGRNSGDDETNPDPEFVDWGITGIASYQGRLVILSGPWVLMSATNNPLRFYRSTVTDLLDNDPISVGSSSATSAAFQYGIPFNKDLLLFSAEYQALVPGGNQALSPRNAQVQVTSMHSADMTSSPISAGRTVMFPMPRSQDFFGVMEMLPSPYTDAQYVSSDSTEHLPKYLQGRCRFGVSSTVASMVLFGVSGDSRSLIVHEYFWNGDEKELRAWHRWTFEFDIAYAYFSGDVINVLTVSGGSIICTKIDPRVGIVDEELNTRPFLDLYVPVQITNSQGTLPDWFADTVGNAEVAASIAEGDLRGSEIGIEIDGSTVTTNRSFIDGLIYVGIPYDSSFAPSPPVIRDEDGSPVTTNKMTLRSYHVVTAGSTEFQASVVDLANVTPERQWDISPIRWSSPELNLGRSPVAGEAGSVLRCNVNSNTGIVEISTKGLGELNVLSLEYVCRTNQRLRRR